MIRNTIRRVRSLAAGRIKNLLKRHGLDAVSVSDLDVCCVPVIQSDPYDDNNSFTLDKIIVRNGDLVFAVSSCCSEHEIKEDDIDTDALLYVLEWLEENEDDLGPDGEEAEDAADEEDEDGQVRITVTCDAGHVGESLIELAFAYAEANGGLTSYETETFIANID